MERGYLQAGTLPGGLTLDPESGLIGGTSTGPAGSSPVTALVTDVDDHRVAAEAAIEVNAALEVTTSSLLDVVVGTAYTATLAATGGITPTPGGASPMAPCPPG
ncbi:putative Ig domain-containing protein [Actinoplanes sp. NPDC051470]|uniref:putative Ig domain-containing protein n=1 Tax=unclassified Actinoplanes TaxID=2626549 RepID=UPI00341C0309